MGWTDRHERYFLRRLSSRAMLYSEMIAAGAIVHGDRERFLRHHNLEHPLGLQLGDSDPARMAEAARAGEKAGFDEVNINVGCPSDRGEHRLFGAHLMKYPQIVADCFQAMAQSVSIPVTIKTRIGVDRQDAYEPFASFVALLAEAGCKVFHVHARKAWLDGLSCKENRDIPPLRYDFVYRLKREFPHLTITLNGGVSSLEECLGHLEHVDGVMMGRAAYHNPFLLARVDELIYGLEPAKLTREDFLDLLEPYFQQELAAGTSLYAMARHLLGLYQGLPGAKLWRRIITQEGVRPGAGIEVIRRARDEVAKVSQAMQEQPAHLLMQA